MSYDIYFATSITFQRGKYIVQCDGEHVGIYLTRKEANKALASAQRKLGKG